jgi:hypothetical protein
VVVAELDNVEAVGSQKIANPPWPAPPKPIRIYWCEGDFKIHSVVKGEIPRTAKKFLWGGTRPGCDLTEHGKGATGSRGPITRVWFVREEGNYIRPLVDAFGVYFLAVKGEWPDGTREEAQKKLGRALLTPDALGMGLGIYSFHFSELASTACFILGRDECIERVQGLANLGNRALRKEACDYLSTQFKEKCAPQEKGGQAGGIRVG